MPSRPLGCALAALTLALLGPGCGPQDPARFCELGAPCPSASEARCRDGQEARLYGRSAFDGRTCVAQEDAPCRRASVTCDLFGQCRGGAPQPDAEAPAMCRSPRADPDHLAAEDPRCVGFGTCVADDASCAASGYCKLSGRCRAEGGICVARDAATCQRSSYCGELGWCDLVTSPLGPRCRPSADAHCQASRVCDNLGNCALSGQSCQACPRSDGCRDEGRCVLDGRRCIATMNAHCQRARACKEEGRCVASMGGCVRG